MKQFFNVDNIMFRGISKWMDYVYVSVLWFVFSIPLITMGAAASALYHTSGQCLRHDRGYLELLQKQFQAVGSGSGHPGGIIRRNPSGYEPYQGTGQD